MSTISFNMDQSKRYCTMRFLYAQEMLQIGFEDDNMLAYETALFHFLELHRLCHHDDLGVRYYVPFVLLVLKRLDDCYGYVKWWAEGYSWEETMEGEWMYLDYEDSLLDIFMDIADDDLEYCHLLALILMKIMIVQDMEKTMHEEWKAFIMGTDETYGKDSHVLKIAYQMPVINKIHGYVKSNSELSWQETMLKEYCNILDNVNPRILKAIAFPEPLMSQAAPSSVSRNSAAEAYHFLSLGLYAFQKTGGNEKIIEMYGKQPHYDYKMGD